MPSKPRNPAPFDAEPASEPLRILLVEDDPLDASLFQDLCRRLPGRYHIRVSMHLADALEQVRVDRFDLAVLDLTLPDAVGTVAVERVLAEDLELAVIVLSGSPDPRLIKACLAAGALDYVQKSELSPRVLRWVVGWAIAQNQQQRFAEMAAALEGYRQMLAWDCEPAAGPAEPLRLLRPEVHRTLVAEYATALETAVRILGRSAAPGDKRALRSVAGALARLGAGPRDVLDLHVAAMERLAPQLHASRRRVLTTEGRLVALELMGLLADLYRARNAVQG